MHEIKISLMKIREALNSMEVRGRQNAELLVYCHEQCGQLLERLRQAEEGGDEG